MYVLALGGLIPFIGSISICPNQYLLSDLSFEHKSQIFDCLLNTSNGKSQGQFKFKMSKVKFKSFHLFSNLSLSLLLFTYGLFLVATSCLQMMSTPFFSNLSLLTNPATSVLYWFLSSSHLDHYRIFLTGHPFCKFLPSIVHPKSSDIHIPYKNILDTFTSLYNKIQSIIITLKALYNWVQLCIW